MNALLMWAESSVGCGLSKIQQILNEIMFPQRGTNTSQFSVSSFLEICPDKTIQVWDIQTEGWYQLPLSVAPVSSEVTINVESRNIKKVQDWKKIHSLTENLYPKYIKLHRYMVLCQKISELDHRNYADNYRFEATNFWEEFRESVNLFDRDLRTLSLVTDNIELINLLSLISLCSSAVAKSLGSPTNSDFFKRGIILIERISDYLLSGLHIADRLLETYFDGLSKTG